MQKTSIVEAPSSKEKISVQKDFPSQSLSTLQSYKTQRLLLNQQQETRITNIDTSLITARRNFFFLLQQSSFLFLLNVFLHVCF